MPFSRLSLRQLLHKTGGEFMIPSYQRRYVWGQLRQGEKDSALYLTQCLNEALDKREDYFLQGITIIPKNGIYRLVDGQQRITYLFLLLRSIGFDGKFKLTFECREEAEKWLSEIDNKSYAEEASDTQDVFYFKKTLRTIHKHIDKDMSAEYVLDHIFFLCVQLDSPTQSIPTFKMMNGTKMPMLIADIIKADIMRIATDATQPNATNWELTALRQRYAAEWEGWLRWWNRNEVKAYYAIDTLSPIDLLLKLCLRNHSQDLDAPLSYEEFRQRIHLGEEKPYHAAKHFFYLLRRTQKKFEEAYEDTTIYNQLKAILLLQEGKQRNDFLRSYFVDMNIDKDQLCNYYKLSFLGMTIEEIARGDSSYARFEDLLATLSMADIYHSSAKREAFNLLLRLNIDEDIKLNRKFDFSIWNNRSLEHIYSKSKVWHLGPKSEVLDGNDNPLRVSVARIMKDNTFLSREDIVNYDGTQLSEHCIGNLVLLYGSNNASFGNANFEEKKMMFLAPGDMSVFRSRNLLHSVCVFAGNKWTQESIVDNYNLTLKNLKLYYGYK